MHSQNCRVGNLLIGFFSESLVFVSKRVIRSFQLLFCHEHREQIAHGCSFVKRDKVNHSHHSLKKSEKSNGRDLLLCIKKGKINEKLSKTYKNMNLFLVNCSFLRAICSNHERITHVALFYRAVRAIHSRSVPLL